jgi:hypothetical protein
LGATYRFRVIEIVRWDVALSGTKSEWNESDI